MLGDVSQLSADATVRTAVCIIGAGAAGITIACQLGDLGIEVCLLEAGGFDYSAAVQDTICGGEFDGTLAATFPQYLTSSRLAYFGGTTNHWAGWCRELDPLDFEPRPWMGSPGWPIRRSELDAYYDRAAQVIELSFDKLRRQGILDRSRAALNGGLPSFDPGSFVISPPTRFGQKYRGELVQSRNVRLFLECRVIGANFPATAKQSDVAEIESVQVLHANGKQFKVAANRFILATGGIENARVLLGIAEASGGRGNAGGWVGRCFMDHPEITIALALAELPETSIAEFKEHLPDGWENRSLTTLYLSPAAQQRESLPNLSVQMTPVGPQVAPPDVREIFQMFGRLFSPSNSSLLHLRIRLEPRANPENRVVLTDERDKAGIRKTHVSWKLGKDDELACKRAAQLFAEEFSRAARARLKLLVKDDAPWQYVTFASHHVGTTRMGVSSKEGVVDAQGTVFGIPNLCVAGSSVFPAAGVSNPTWTIVALALRLGDRIAESLGGGSK